MPKDPVLPDRFAAGDPEQFGKIVELYRERIYRVAFSMTGDRAEAEDVTQEVFLSAFRARATFRGESAIGTWLYRIAVNASLDLLARRRGPTETIDQAERNPGLPMGSANDPERSAQSSLVGEKIKAAMDRLSPRERAVFVLRHYEDLPLKAVASTLSVRVGTVKSLLYRAIVKLQKELSIYREE